MSVRQELTTTIRVASQIKPTCLFDFRRAVTHCKSSQRNTGDTGLHSLPIVPITLSKHLSLQPAASYATDAAPCFT